jgi:hypothetical protein
MFRHGQPREFSEQPGPAVPARPESPAAPSGPAAASQWVTMLLVLLACLLGARRPVDTVRSGTDDPVANHAPTVIDLAPALMPVSPNEP